MSATETDESLHDVVVVGGGAAGVGVAVALQHAGIRDLVVLERHIVGASFAMWPAETRFITPSFPTNSIGMLDLNSVAIGTSPAFMLEVEHPTGEQFAIHLNAVAKHFQLPIREETEVKRIGKADGVFTLTTDTGVLRARHVVWAGGEFQYPALSAFPGSKLCRHTATVKSYGEIEGDEVIVIGGYESGIDAAYHLAARGKRVKLFDSGCPWEAETSDPSIALSVYSLERMRQAQFVERVELVPNTTIASVRRTETGFAVKTDGGNEHTSAVPPLFAGGFDGGHKRLDGLFEMREDGFPVVTDRDESTKMPGLYLAGPALRHDNHIFCFIYKYRQRFAVVAKAVATSLGLPAEGLEVYRQWGMYLDDLSCCGEECVC